MATSALVGVFLLAAIQQSVLSACNTYYIKPTNDIPCPGEPCLTLLQYIQEANFTSNTTLLFLPGEHTLNTVFQVFDVASFTLRGNTSSLPKLTSKIVCTNGTGKFQFTLVQHLDIRSLHFVQCGNPITIPEPKAHALFVRITGNFHLEMCVFELCPSGALYMGEIAEASLLNNTFMSNKAIAQAPAINVYDSIVMSIDNTFLHNEKQDLQIVISIGAGAIYAQDCNLTFSGRTIFSNNSAGFTFGGAMTARNTTIVLEGNTDFVNNSAGQSGGGISVQSSVLHFDGNVTFMGNLATDEGGAISMSVTDESEPKLYLYPNTVLSFHNNSANMGGAISVQDLNPFKSCPEVIASSCRQDDCFFQVLDQNISTGFSSKLEFINNSATASGDAIFGGNIDHCNLEGFPAKTSGEVFDLISILEQPDTGSVISSNPLQICSCENEHPNCSSKFLNTEAYPGETFAVNNIVAVGQRNGIVPASILSFFGSTDDKHRFGDFETVQMSRKCGDHHYTVFTLVSSDTFQETINLYPQGPCPTLDGNPLTIGVQIRPCPKGFVLSSITGGCICEDRLMTYTNSCNITDQTILRDGTFWVGYDNITESLILHPHCPFDYCKTEPVKFRLNDTNLECVYNRTGLLCGSCQPGLSLALGSNRCLRCSNNYLSLLIVFAVAGCILVTFLLACKLTVASGTINGLIFYANIVAINKSIFFPPGATNPLTVFIAWVNLDLGIETCFYNGMDSYTKMWLQFVFPFYIIALTGFIIVLRRYSRLLERLLQHSNPLAVLATLFLLSFTKLLRTITNILTFTGLDYQNHTETVWVFDGDIRYLHNKHVSLAVVALLVFLVLVLPYTLLLVLGQWLLKSYVRVLHLVVYRPHIRIFLEANYAPYEHRYWPGILLLWRYVLLLVYNSTIFSNGSTNLLIISATTLGLELWAWIQKHVYRRKYLDILEGSFIFNLGLLAAATYHVRLAGGNQAAVVYTSVSVALVTFIGILTYHTVQQLKRCGYCLKSPNINIQDPSQAHSEESRRNVSRTTVAIECREPLLDAQ